MDEHEAFASCHPGASHGATRKRGRHARPRLPSAIHGGSRRRLSPRPRPMAVDRGTWKGRALRLMLEVAVDALKRSIGERARACPDGARPRLDPLARDLAMTQGALEALMRMLDERGHARSG